MRTLAEYTALLLAAETQLREQHQRVSPAPTTGELFKLYVGEVMQEMIVNPLADMIETEYRAGLPAKPEKAGGKKAVACEKTAARSRWSPHQGAREAARRRKRTHHIDASPVIVVVPSRRAGVTAAGLRGRDGVVIVDEPAFHSSHAKQRTCRLCGCTQNAACVTDEGPCYWVEEDLCSGCLDREEVQ